MSCWAGNATPEANDARHHVVRTMMVMTTGTENGPCGASAATAGNASITEATPASSEVLAVWPFPGVIAQLAEYGQSGLDPTEVAAKVLNAVRRNELYVFTHHSAEWRAELTERFDAILMAMDEAAARQRT
jgi:hypothetical protein